jgi:ribonuclease HII
MTKKDIINLFNDASISDYSKLIKEHLYPEKVKNEVLIKRYQKKYSKYQQLLKMNKKLNEYESSLIAQGHLQIAGIDEVGRGCLAGPLVVGIVVLDINKPILGLNDSKQMSKSKRESLYQEIIEKSIFYDTIVIDSQIVDEQNIYQATKNGMERLVNDTSFDFYLIDAMKLDTPKDHLSLIKGDTLSNSIAAASIIAKVTRDKMMDEYALLYPEFDFKSNSGYGTKTHLKALDEFGYTKIHRKTYGPVKDNVEKGNRYFIKRKV